MNTRVRVWTLLFVISLPVLAWSQPCPSSLPGTRVGLADGATGREIVSRVLCDGETATLSWMNSLFGLRVTEVYEARRGRLVQTKVAFSLPGGGPPPSVTPQDVDDLYHTGGPFAAEGLSRPVEKVIFRVGEIGNPTFTIGERTVDFTAEVGFGGTVILDARAAPISEKR